MKRFFRQQFNKQKIRTLCIYVAVFSLVFIGGVVLFGAYFVRDTFGNVPFSQILFHLRFPLLDNNTPFVGKFINKVIIPAFLCAFCITFPQLVLKVIITTIGFLFQKATFGKVAFAFVLFALCLNITNNKLKITRYLKTQETYSNLYENHYKPFDSANLADFKPKQNLIVILAESMESTFSSKNIPAQIGGGGGNSLDYSPFGELIPNLSNLALKNTNFSTTDALGGVNQLNSTGWTIAGTIGYLCGIPLNIPIYGNDFNNKHFLDSAICVSDILADLGYKQAYFSNFDAKFSGMKFLMESHSVDVLDLPYFQAQNLVPKPLPKDMQGIWDLKDAELFKLAKNHLESLSDSQPFVLYISTIDTHSTDNFWVDKASCPGFGTNYIFGIRCADKIISDFVDFVQSSKFGKNTTIIILGDHLSMQQGFFPQNTKRFIYNAFINPRFTQKPTLKLTKNRELSHFDITPLILDSIGIRAESFGLGRNPLYGKSLLESEFDINSLNALLVQRNKIYDSFWEVKK